MDIKIIKKEKHYLFDSLIEYKKLYKEKVSSNWRHGEEGEWVYTDDFYICQILKKVKLNHPGYKTPRIMMRTVCGSFIVQQKTHKMLGGDGVADNIYAFSGNNNAKKNYARDRNLNTREFIFASFISSGLNPVNSYKKAYPKSKDLDYIKRKSHFLLKKKAVRKMIIKATNIAKKNNTSLLAASIEKEKNRKLRNEYVYFIKSNNSLKIGVSHDPKKRLNDLQTANAHKLELIGYINGDSSKERKIQSEMCKYHMRGEWFKYCENVKRHVNRLIEKERMHGNE